MIPKHIVVGQLIELRDEETTSWIQLTIASVSGRDVECHMLDGAKILTTVDALVKDARLRPRDGSCVDCGYDAHDGPCVERICSECGHEVSGRCSQHPYQPVHVYRRKRYLADIEVDKPYPTREFADGIRKDLIDQMDMLRRAEKPRESRVMITVTARSEVLSALENAVQLIESLPSEKRKRQ